MSYSLSGSLPSGVSFNSSSRRLSGTPTSTQGTRWYTYRVRDADGDSDTLSFSIKVNAGTPPSTPSATPPAPTGLSATAVQQRDIAVTWNSVSGVRNPNGYELNAGNLGEFDLSHNGKSFSHLECGTTYTFIVKAYGDGINYKAAWGPEAGPVEATTEECAVMSITASPTKITEGDKAYFTISADRSRSFSLQVQIAVSVVGNFLNGSAPTSVFFSRFKNSVTFALQTKDDGGNNGDGSVKVEIEKSEGYQGKEAHQQVKKGYIIGSPSSATVNIETQTPTPTPTPGTAPAPGSVSVSDPTKTSLKVSWNAVTNGHGYKVERRKSGGSWSTIRTGVSELEVTTSGLTCGTRYGFRVSTKGDGDPYSTNYGTASSERTGDTSACSPTPPDSAPSFAGKSIAPIVVAKGVEMTSVILPEATGGDGDLTYSVSGPTASAESGPKAAAFDGPVHGGIRFNSSERKLYGTPTTAQDANTYIYTATDSDTGGKLPKDSATLSFTITVGPPKATPPQNPKVSLDKKNGDTALEVKWSRVLLAAEYKVEWMEHGSSGWDPGDHATTTDEEITINGLKPDTKYYFRVRAKGDGILLSTEWGDSSKIVSIWTDKELVVTVVAKDYWSLDEKTGNYSRKYTFTESSPVWSVLHPFDMDIVITGKYGDKIVPKGYKFKFILDVDDTGLQFSDNRECNWTTPEGETGWTLPLTADTSEFTLTNAKVVRCGKGNIENTGFTVQAHNGTNISSYTIAKAMTEAWHRADHQLGYWIQDTEEDPFMDGEKPSHISEDYEPVKVSDVIFASSEAAKQWNAKQDRVVFEAVSSGADTKIRGYWYPASGPGECGIDALACVKAGGTYPHLGFQEFWIKFPPEPPTKSDFRKWTTDVEKARQSSDYFYYLTQVMMHEFGHNVGLGSTQGPYLMGYVDPENVLDVPTKYDLDGMEHIYKGHKKH